MIHPHLHPHSPLYSFVNISQTFGKNISYFNYYLVSLLLPFIDVISQNNKLLPPSLLRDHCTLPPKPPQRSLYFPTQESSEISVLSHSTSLEIVVLSHPSLLRNHCTLPLKPPQRALNSQTQASLEITVLSHPSLPGDCITLPPKPPQKSLYSPTQASSVITVLSNPSLFRDHCTLPLKPPWRSQYSPTQASSETRAKAF